MESRKVFSLKTFCNFDDLSNADTLDEEKLASNLDLIDQEVESL